MDLRSILRRADSEGDRVMDGMAWVLDENQQWCLVEDRKAPPAGRGCCRLYEILKRYQPAWLISCVDRIRSSSCQVRDCG